MRLVRLEIALLVLAAGTASAAGAHGWQGLVPGAASEPDIVARFGQPSTQGRAGGRVTLVYRDDQAISGTRQAQFRLRDDGVLGEIVVFPTNKLDRETVEGTYGSPTRKAFTDDFTTVWVFTASGITVYFGKDGFVEAISFKSPAAATGAAARSQAARGPEPVRERSSPGQGETARAARR